MSSEDNKALVRRYFEEVWNKGNSAALGEFVTDDVRDYAPGPNPTPGHGSVIAHHQQVFANLLDFHIEMEEFVAEGDVVFWTGTATHAQTLAPVGASAVPHCAALK
ncbi:MAG: ester cyclase [Dehalococcoidia bacterium]